MSKKGKIILDDNLEEKFMDSFSKSINENGIDVKCLNCGKDIHLSFSGDSCPFCGFIIHYGVDPQI